MAGLVLKAVQWGVDKMPDSAFEAIPGNFYKPKDHDKRRRSSRHHGDDRDNRRHSDDEYDGHRHRHHGDHGRRHRSRGHDHGRSRSKRRSYEDSEDDVSQSPPRRRSESHHRRRRSYVDNDNDDDRYGYTNGHDGRPPRDRGYEERPARPPYPVSSTASHEDRNPHGPGGRATAAAAAAGGAVAITPHDDAETVRSPPSDSRSNNSIEQGYVPYSNIYGQPARPADPQSFGSPPPMHEQQQQPARTIPEERPVGLPPHLQNPTPQQISRQRSNYDPAPQEDYNSRYYDDGYTAYDSRPESLYTRPHSRSRSRRSRGRRTHAPSSYTDFDSRYDADSRYYSDEDEDYDRRTQSEKPGASRSKSKSRAVLEKNFDPSKRGLGYGAIGALTGALVGSEVGKGPLPAIIGAVIGGAGTNAFQAREKRKEGRRQDLVPRDRLGDRRDKRVVRTGEGYYSD